MIYREMAGERVSRLGLGGMRLPVRGLLRSIDRQGPSVIWLRGLAL